MSLRKKRMEIKAKINAAINPAIKNGNASNWKYIQFFMRDIPLAPIIIGTAIIKVKSAAVRCVIPVITPPEIVAPDRENPGHKEKDRKSTRLNSSHVAISY